MKIDVQRDKPKPGFCTLTPHGPIDSDTYMEFQNGIQPLLNPTIKAVLLDLRDVEYISSAGLGVIFTTKKTLLSRGGDLIFCNLKPQIKKLFEIVKALPVESIFASEKEADAYFYKIMNEEIQKQKGGGEEEG